MDLLCAHVSGMMGGRDAVVACAFEVDKTIRA